MNSESLVITILGSGTSQGVPVIACECDVCTSEDERDKRLRCSIMVTCGGENYVIDTGPDFRQQMLREKVQSLRAVLFTHEHKDHVAGLDDVRAFNFKEKRDMEVYCSDLVEVALKREFHYVFSDFKYPGIPTVNLNTIDKDSRITLPGGLEIEALEVMHYKLPVLGFKMNNTVAYITDAKTVEEKERRKIRGVKTLIINALRIEEHLSHFNLEEALEFIKDIKPERAYLTHISHLFGKHEEIEKMLPENVFVVSDGMKIEINY